MKVDGVLFRSFLEELYIVVNLADCSPFVAEVNATKLSLTLYEEK